MAAKTFTVETAAWVSDEDGKDDVTILGVSDITVQEGGNFQTFFGDGNVYSTFAWFDNYTETITLTSADLSLIGVATHLIAVGDLGLLTIKMPKRLAGIAGKDGTDESGLQYICGGGGGVPQVNGCVVTGIPTQAAQEGVGAVAYSFGVTSIDGVTAPVAVSMYPAAG